MRDIRLRYLGQWASAVTMLALVTLFGMLVGRDTAHATSFDPQITVEVADTTAGATSDIITGLNIPAPDSNFGGNVGLIPAQWGVAADADIPDGAVVAFVRSLATLSLLASPCSTTLTVEFTMVDGTTNTSNTITPAGPPDDPLENLAQDADNNGIFDAADKYPSYLNEMFPGVTPRARLVGWTDPVDGLTVILNFIVFEPGDTIAEVGVTPDERLGFPSVTVLQNPEAAPGASVIGDFCTTLLANTTTFGVTRDNQCSPPPGPGDCGEPAATKIKNRVQAVEGVTSSGEGGHVYRTNPPDGLYTFLGYGQSLYDADDDGIENPLDTCPYTANPEFNPRAENPALDPDNDGIPSICDDVESEGLPPIASVPPCPTSGIFDNDEDCFGDRGDNCPQVKNGIDDFGNTIGLNNQADTDSDGIGDSCDNDPIRPDGHRHELCSVIPVTIGAGGAPDRVDITIGGATCSQVVVAAAAADGAADGGGGDSGDGDGGGAGAGGSQVSIEEQFLATLTPGLNLKAVSTSVAIDGSTSVLAAFADAAGNPLSNIEVTCQIEQQPGTDASLDGKAEVTLTTDVKGLAKPTLNAGTKTGSIVVLCASEDQEKRVTVTVVEAGPATGVGSLAPAVASIPAWAAIASGLGGAGLLGGLGALASRVLRRRRQ